MQSAVGKTRRDCFRYIGGTQELVIHVCEAVGPILFFELVDIVIVIIQIDVIHKYFLL